MKKLTTVAMLSVAGYIAAQMLADITSLKIAVIAGLAIDGGTFIYPFTFTLRDMVHKSWGRAMARKLIITAGAINVLMALMFQFVIWLPADSSWGLQEQFATILGPVWRIVFASILAEIVSELLDTEAYHFFVTKVTTKYQWARVLFSNSVSVPLDSLVFAFAAFYGLMPIAVVWSIVLSNVLVKMAMTIVSLPGIYLVKDEAEVG
jgi:uncharacterized integral membrane protein (TIGR00697 family)